METCLPVSPFSRICCRFSRTEMFWGGCYRARFRYVFLPLLLANFHSLTFFFFFFFFLVDRFSLSIDFLPFSFLSLFPYDQTNALV